jgi:hypothetical protein
MVLSAHELDRAHLWFTGTVRKLDQLMQVLLI